MALRGMYDDSEKKEKKHKSDEGNKEERELDPNYASIIRQILPSVDEKSRGDVVGVLQSPRGEKTYHSLKRSGMPNRVIVKVIGDSVQDIAEDRDVSPGAYLEALGSELKSYEGYERAIEAMHQDGILSERQRDEYIGTVKGHTRKRTSVAHEDLEYLASQQSKKRMAAVWIFLIGGAALMMLSGSTVTGGVIGTKVSPTASFIFGFILFVIGLLMKKR